MTLPSMEEMPFVMLQIQWVMAVPCVLEPFERNNVARAVHEKIKFDAIKAEFAEVHARHDNCALFILFLPATSY